MMQYSIQYLDCRQCLQYHTSGSLAVQYSTVRAAVGKAIVLCIDQPSQHSITYWQAQETVRLFSAPNLSLPLPPPLSLQHIHYLSPPLHFIRLMLCSKESIMFNTDDKIILFRFLLYHFSTRFEQFSCHINSFKYQKSTRLFLLYFNYLFLQSLQFFNCLNVKLIS